MSGQLFLDEAIPVIRKLLQAHTREICARYRHQCYGETEIALTDAAIVTEAAIMELAQLLDDRMQDHVARLVRRAGLSLTESDS